MTGPSIGQSVTQRLAAIDPAMTPERIAAKIANAKIWWRRAGIAALVTVVLIGAALLILSRAHGVVATPVLVFLGGIIGLGALATLYCVNQADSEATKEFIKDLVTLRGLLPFGSKNG